MAYTNQLQNLMNTLLILEDAGNIEAIKDTVNDWIEWNFEELYEEWREMTVEDFDTLTLDTQLKLYDVFEELEAE